MYDDIIGELYDIYPKLNFWSEKIDTSGIDENTRTSLYIGTLIRLLQNNLTYNMNQDLKSLELTFSQFEIIAFLISNDGEEINQKDIEHKFNLKNPTVTGLLKRLEAKGFIKRYASEHDGRYKKIVLTEKSRFLKDNIYDAVVIQSKKFFKNITEDEKKSLINVLIKLNRNAAEMNKN